MMALRMQIQFQYLAGIKFSIVQFDLTCPSLSLPPSPSVSLPPPGNLAVRFSVLLGWVNLGLSCLVLTQTGQYDFMQLLLLLEIQRKLLIEIQVFPVRLHDFTACEKNGKSWLGYTHWDRQILACRDSLYFSAFPVWSVLLKRASLDNSLNQFFIPSCSFHRCFNLVVPPDMQVQN